MRIYLDNCCYNRPYDDSSQYTVVMEAQAKMVIQERIRSGLYDLVGSYILDYEVTNNPFQLRRDAIRQFITENVKRYVGSERDAVLTPTAHEIMATGLKEKDAYHVAAAIYAECNYFITTDKRLLKYQTPAISLVTPIQFIYETEGEGL